MKITNRMIVEMMRQCVNPSRTKLTKQNYVEEIIKPLEEYLKNTEIKFEAYSGATKLCLVPIDDENNFVIKIPFTGYEYSDDYHEFKSDGYGITYEVGNYCEIELERSLCLIRNGYGDKVAKVSYICTIDDIHIYKQEKVIRIAENYDVSRINPLAEQYMQINGLKLDDIDIYWLSSLYDYSFNDKKEVEDFLNFISYTGYLEDLNDCNVGWTSHFRPVIFDISGYHEEFDF